VPTHLKAIEPAPSTVETQSRFVTLAGNPNSGKTSLFNAVTGTHQHVGNYPRGNGLMQGRFPPSPGQPAGRHDGRRA